MKFINYDYEDAFQKSMEDLREDGSGRYLEKDRVDRLLEEREIGALLGRDDLMEWMSAPYDKLQKYPEHLIHMVKDDVAVRSKSEEIIMNVLDRYHIAYRYDCVIEINGHILHPDFILRDPKTGKFILWEHLGAMDKEEYRQNARWKLNQYMEAGYKLRRKTHRLVCGMKVAFLCKTTFLLLNTYIDWIHNLCINQ